MKKELVGIILVLTLVAMAFAGCLFKSQEEQDEETLILFTIYVVNNSDYNHSINISIWNTSTQFYWNFTCYIEKYTNTTFNKELPPIEIQSYIDFTEIDDRGNYHPAPKMGARRMVSDKNNIINIRIANGDYLVTG